MTSITHNLMYASYRFQRTRLTADQCAKLFPDADLLEKQYQDELQDKHAAKCAVEEEARIANDNSVCGIVGRRLYGRNRW